MFENYMSKISFKFPRGQWVKVDYRNYFQIPLYDKTGYIHVWCHIFVQNYNAAQHHLVSKTETTQSCDCWI